MHVRGLWWAAVGGERSVNRLLRGLGRRPGLKKTRDRGPLALLRTTKTRLKVAATQRQECRCQCVWESSTAAGCESLPGQRYPARN